MKKYSEHNNTHVTIIDWKKRKKVLIDVSAQKVDSHIQLHNRERK